MPRQVMAEGIQSTDTGDVWMVLVWSALDCHLQERYHRLNNKREQYRLQLEWKRKLDSDDVVSA